MVSMAATWRSLQGIRGDLQEWWGGPGREMGWSIHQDGFLGCVSIPGISTNIVGGTVLVSSTWDALWVFKGRLETLGSLRCTCPMDPAGGPGR